MATGISGIKRKAYEIEIVSYQNPKSSKMAILEVDKPKKIGQLQCDLCKTIVVENFLEKNRDK
ncbi:hypothetical protein BpHYR1_021515 [Brachionus plicatilis]|uniref:Uncharacterized protein n=1 Tax=Brachionus plicatilis TaxID=10195 RepID=A0A3M7T1Q2_BRAPC|nr:hypothetical protein BpHYR1_021515 [Brachionus plicatilis]